MSLQHFKKLYDIAKIEGVGAALNHDALETLKRHPKVAICAISGYVLLSSCFYEPKIDEDKGRVEVVNPPKDDLYSRLQ